MRPIRVFVPWSLLWLRVTLAPTIVVLGISSVAGYWLAIVLAAALLTDIYDGVLARRWHCATAAMRLADSLADTVFYLGVLMAIAVRRPAILRHDAGLLATLLLLEAVRYVVDLRKFGRAASYHSYLAKLWGLVMAVAVMTVLVSPGVNWLFAGSLVLGIVSNLEGLLFSALLPKWTHDVKSVKHALKHRNELLRVRSAIEGEVRSHRTLNERP